MNGGPITELLVPLVAPTITGYDEAYMAGRIQQGLLTDEGEVRFFEDYFAEWAGCEWAVAVNSGTNALALALETSFLDLDEPVRVQSYTCRAVTNAVAMAGATVRFVDSHFDVKTATAGVEFAHVLCQMFGQRCNTTVAPVVEDWTLSFGQETRIGGYTIGVCSTMAGKMISTGRGGVIFGNDEDLHARVTELVHYERHTGFGYSVAMSSTQAALGNSQLAQLDGFIERRRELAARYTDAFRPVGIECPDADCGSVFFRYLIETKKPWEMVARLAERGIQAGRGVHPALHQLAGLPDDQFPGTTAAVNSLLSVPVHPSITDDQAAHIIDSVIEVCAP